MSVSPAPCARTGRASHAAGTAAPGAPPGGVSRGDGARQKFMGTLIVLFAASILMEGVLRKWLLNPIEKPLFFVREPFLFAIYLVYLMWFRPNARWIMPFCLYALAVSVLAVAQNIYWQYPALVPFLAVRYFVVYVPLAFIMADVMTPGMLRRVLRFLFLVSVPCAALVIAQFLSPVAHPINKGLTDEVIGRFVVVKDLVRPYGPFTFVLGQVHFAAMMTALGAACWDQRRKLGLSGGLVAVGMVSALVMGALSGGRTYFAYLMLIGLAYLLAGFTSGRLGLGVRRLAGLAALSALFLLIFVVIFPRAYEAMSMRQADAVASEGSSTGRALSLITSGADALENAPLFGKGIGSGINAARSSISADTSFANGEYEWARLINEFGPIFGLPMLALRSWLVLWLGWGALWLNRRNGDGAALIFWGFVGPMLATASITMQNALVGINWFCVGLLLVLIRLGRQQQQSLRLP